jgi:hypothetical protein
MTHFRLASYRLSVQQAFEMLRRQSPLPLDPFEFCVYLNDRLHAPDVEFNPPIEGVWQIGWADGRLTFQTAAGLRDPSTVFIRFLAPSQKLMVPANISMGPDGKIVIKVFDPAATANDAAAAPLASESQPTPKPVSRKMWLTDEVKRRRQAGDVPDIIAHFARELYAAMETAAKEGKVDRAYKTPAVIESRLRDWRLW